MFTSSIVLLMIINTVAASAAPFVALQASALDISLRVASAPSAKHTTGIADGGFPEQEGGVADVA
jgi:hypothetical protein